VRKLIKPKKKSLNVYSCYTSENATLNTVIQVSATVGASLLAATVSR